MQFTGCEQPDQCPRWPENEWPYCYSLYCDRVETHYRGLEALGIEQNTYSSMVVSHILDCLTKSVCLNIIREKEFHEWT